MAYTASGSVGEYPEDVRGRGCVDVYIVNGEDTFVERVCILELGSGFPPVIPASSPWSISGLENNSYKAVYDPPTGYVVVGDNYLLFDIDGADVGNLDFTVTLARTTPSTFSHYRSFDFNSF